MSGAMAGEAQPRRPNFPMGLAVTSKPFVQRAERITPSPRSDVQFLGRLSGSNCRLRYGAVRLFRRDGAKVSGLLAMKGLVKLPLPHAVGIIKEVAYGNAGNRRRFG